MIKIACPRLDIEPCSPAEFSERINAIHEFPEASRPENDERADLTILSCMVALGGKAKCKILPLTGFMHMHSRVGDLVVGKSKDGKQVFIFEAYKENGEVKIRQ